MARINVVVRVNDEYERDNAIKIILTNRPCKHVYRCDGCIIVTININVTNIFVFSE
jgi:hypothetical protein